MASVVVDASAIAAIAFDEPDADAVARRLRGLDLIAPTLLPFELASICAKKIRRVPDAANALRANFSDALDAVRDIREVDAHAILRVALQSGLSAYDAAYLWLSRDLGVELVTLDKRLENASRS